MANEESLKIMLPHEITFTEFCVGAKATKLLNHGRKWQVYFGNSDLGFCDSISKIEAMREAHCREVNNALYSNSKDAPKFMGKMSMPPMNVIAEYPEMKQRFADVLKVVTQRNHHLENGGESTNSRNAKGIQMDDLSKCPQCGGDADNGIDNCIPPSAYMCSKCCAQEDAEKAGNSGFDEGQNDPHLPAFHKALHAGYKGTFYEWHKEHFGTFWCTGVAA